MTADRPPREESLVDVLDVLACEYEARPKDAPSFFDLQPAVRSVRRDDNALVVEFDPARGDDVRRLVAAERLCCTTIGWDLREHAGLTLRITAAPAQLDVFEQFVRAE